jgi:hypothetical protein
MYPLWSPILQGLYGESNPAAVLVVNADVTEDVTNSGYFISYVIMLNYKSYYGGS